MKFIVFGDLHMHNWSYGSNLENGLNSRLLAQERVVDQITEYCKKEDIKQVFFGGDLFHTHSKLDVSVLVVAYRSFERLSRQADITMLVGNHDMADKSGKIHSLSSFEGLHRRVDVIDTEFEMEYDDGFGEVCCLPYTEDKERLKRFLNGAPKDSLVFLHQGLANVPQGSGFVINEILTTDMIPDHVKHVYLSHYHSHKRISDKLTVIGSVMQHTWDDVGDKRGWLVVDSETGEYEQIESDAPKFKIIDIGMGLDLDPPSVLLSSEVKNNYIKVKNWGEDQEKLRRLLMANGALSVDFHVLPVREDAINISINEFDIPSIIREYENLKEVDERGQRIGNDLMAGNYEAPELRS